MEEEQKKSRLFRESALQRQSAAPENLYDYIKVSSPSSWLVLAACGAVLIGLLIWAFFGEIAMNKTVVGIANDNTLTCCLNRSDAQKLSVGMTATCGDSKGKITYISYNAVSIHDVEAAVSDAVVFQADLPEYSYPVIITFDSDLKGEICDASILLQSMRPIDYLLSGSGD